MCLQCLIYIIAHKNGKHFLSLVKCMIGWFPFRIINSFGTKIQINTENAFEDEIITGFDKFNKFDKVSCIKSLKYINRLFEIDVPLCNFSKLVWGG